MRGGYSGLCECEHLRLGMLVVVVVRSCGGVGSWDWGLSAQTMGCGCCSVGDKSIMKGSSRGNLPK